MSEEKLIEILHQLKDEELEWDEVNVDQLVDAMIKYIQSIDVSEREKTVIPILSDIIHKQMDEDSLEALALRCVKEDHLYSDIGDTESSNKITRAFSMLILKELLKRDANDVFMSNPTFDRVRKEVLLYIDLEQDYRGYNEELGWVNSIIYSIDAIHEMIKNTRLDPSLHTEMFQTLVNKMFTFQNQYQFDEEEHTVSAIQELLKKGFSEKKLIDFFARVPMFLEKQKEKLNPFQYWNLYKNCKQLLMEMYVKMDLEKNNPLLFTEVKNCLKKL